MKDDSSPEMMRKFKQKDVSTEDQEAAHDLLEAAERSHFAHIMVGPQGEQMSVADGLSRCLGSIGNWSLPQVQAYIDSMVAQQIPGGR